MTSKKITTLLAICFIMLSVSCSTKLIGLKDKEPFPTDIGKGKTILIIGDVQLQDINNLEKLISKNYKGEIVMYNAASRRDSLKYKDTDKYRFEMNFFERRSSAVRTQNLSMMASPEYSCGVIDKKTNITYRIAGPYYGSRRKPVKRCLQLLESLRKKSGE